MTDTTDEKLPMARVKIAPEICSYMDDENLKLKLEVSLPGVKKEDIKLKMHDDSFSITALRGDDIEYVSSMTFCCPVKAKETTSNYENGLLRIETPYKDPMEDAVDITIH